MNTQSKFSTKVLAAAIGLLVATGAVANASAATVTTTKSITRVAHPGVVKKSVRFIGHHRAHLAGTRILLGHRLAPRVAVVHRLGGKRVVKVVTTKRLVGTQRSAMAHRVVSKTIVR